MASGMSRLFPSLFFKFLLGILLTQAITALLVYLALRSADPQTWGLFAVLGGILGLLTTLFLSGLAAHGRREAIARAHAGFARERERLKVQAERSRHRVLEKTRKAAERQARRAQAGASFKVRASVVGLFGMGLFMMFTQFMTLGVVLLTTGGGALAGYLFRLRQEPGGTGAAATLSDIGLRRFGRIRVKALAAAPERDSQA